MCVVFGGVEILKQKTYARHYFANLKTEKKYMHKCEHILWNESM